MVTTRGAVEVTEKDLDYICQQLLSDLPDMEGKRLLISGGAGFLGYYLIKTIQHWNRHHVKNKFISLTVYDNFIRGIPTWLNETKTDKNIVILERDVSQLIISTEENFDFIIHAASIASPFFYRLHPIKTMDTNVNGLRSILNYAHERQTLGKPLTSILFFSSSEIYGEPTPENIPTPESYFGHVSCTGARACYDESKRYGETLCVNFMQQYGIPVKIVRPFNNYGPGLKISDRRVIPDFVRDILNNRDIVLLSDGKPKRTFCYVADAMVGYFKALMKGKNGEPYNIGTETPEITMIELAELIIAESRKLFAYQGQLKFEKSHDNQYLSYNPQRRCPVIKKAREELGYNPGISLQEGMRRSLIWYKENQYAEDA
jgi:UDP-glucuronate decarboxylase